MTEEMETRGTPGASRQRWLFQACATSSPLYTLKAPAGHWEQPGEGAPAAPQAGWQGVLLAQRLPTTPSRARAQSLYPSSVSCPRPHTQKSPSAQSQGWGSLGACPAPGAQPRHAGGGVGGGPANRHKGGGRGKLVVGGGWEGGRGTFQLTQGMVVPDHPHLTP